MTDSGCLFVLFLLLPQLLLSDFPADDKRQSVLVAVMQEVPRYAFITAKAFCSPWGEKPGFVSSEWCQKPPRRHLIRERKPWQGRQSNQGGATTGKNLNLYSGGTRNTAFEVLQIRTKWCQEEKKFIEGLKPDYVLWMGTHYGLTWHLALSPYIRWFRSQRTNATDCADVFGVNASDWMLIFSVYVNPWKI